MSSINRRKFIKRTAQVTALSALAPVAFGMSKEEQNTFPPVSEALIRSFEKRIKPITPEERKKRREKAQQLMREEKFDVLFIEGGASMEYFTGVSWWRSERLFAMILFPSGDPVFISPKFEELRAMEQAGEFKVHTWEENESPYELIVQLFKENNLLKSHIGIEESTRFLISENILKTIPGLKIENANAVTAACRSVKSSAEIELMQIANDITAEVYKWAVPQLREGMTEAEFGKIISKGFSLLGTEGGALVLFGEASALPHGHRKENRLRSGDIVLIDGGCSVEGYESDITRTTAFGKPTDKMKKNFDLVLKAQQEALHIAKPGIAAELVDAAARKVITDAGFGPGFKYFTHPLGHGIGMEGHEWFYLVGGNKRPLFAGNMFSNEPGIYVPGEFGIRIEDEMLITDAGAKLLLPAAQSLDKMF